MEAEFLILRKPSDFKSHKMHQSMVRSLSLGTLDSRFSQAANRLRRLYVQLAACLVLYILPSLFGFSSVILMFDLHYD